MSFGDLIVHTVFPVLGEHISESLLFMVGGIVGDGEIVFHESFDLFIVDCARKVGHALEFASGHDDKIQF